MKNGRRVSGWQVLRFAVAILGVVLGGTFLWVRSLANDHWARMEARLAELEVERNAQPTTRPVLRGDPIPGNAWEFYGAALESAPYLPLSPEGTLYFRRGGPAPVGMVPAAQSAMDAWAAPCDAALTSLRTGTQRGEVRPTLVWERSFTPIVREMSGRGSLWSVWRAAVVKARGHFERGQSEDAVELLMDLAQFGRDGLQGTSLQMTSNFERFLRAVVDELQYALKNKQLSQEALQRLNRELEILDEGWPKIKSMMLNQIVAFGRGCKEEVNQGSLLYEGSESTRSFRSWRWGYSSRFRAASTFLYADSMLQRMLRAAEEPLAKSQSFQFFQGVHAWPDPVLGVAFNGPNSHNALQERTRFRLVRLAASFQSTGEVLDLADPYGDRLQTSVSERTLRIWSAGVNGVDDGGNELRDLVLEVER